MKLVDIYLNDFDLFINNVVCRYPQNQEQANRIFRNKIQKILGRDHPFIRDLVIEMIHYNSYESITEQFGEYLKQKKTEFKELVLISIISDNKNIVNHYHEN